MADQWNANIPAMANQISADIPDIKENLEHAKDAFQRIFQTWSDAAGGNAAAKFNSAVGFYDGTYNYEFPTNPTIAADSVIMLGNSDTIVWMYLNTAPPGWKAKVTLGADMVLAVSGGTSAYNVDGGNPDSAATWTISGLSSSGGSHSHSHSHKWYDVQTTSAIDKDGAGTNLAQGTSKTSANYYHINISSLTTDNPPNADLYTDTDATTSASHSHTIAQNGGWRPKASVGKLFQLDTA